MYNIVKDLGLFLTFLLSVSTATAQMPELTMHQVHYQSEVEQVLHTISEGKSEPFFLLSLARSYYQLDKYIEAEKYYLEVIGEPFCTNLDYKALAICLRYNEKTSLANEFYQKYTESIGQNSFQDLWSTKSKRNTAHTITKEILLTRFDFIYGNLNPDGSTYMNIDHGTVSANFSCDGLINLKAIQFPVEDFSKLGTFTKGIKPGSFYYSYQNTTGFYGIYYILKKGAGWTKPKALQLGETTANYCFPFVINSKLYFSSDMSGGNGQYDLYHAQMVGTKAETITNLGSNINTEKNDILPSVIDGKFSFSSNGLPGPGAYDVYFSDWSFSRVEMLQAPFNSSQNEFMAISIGADNATIVKSHNASINVCKVETYYDYTRTLLGRVVDSDDNVLSDARILFTKSYVDQGIFQTSLEDGRFSLDIPDTVDTWKIECHKTGYESNNFELKLSTLGDNPLIIVMNKIKEVEPEPVYIVNSRSRNVVPAAPKPTTDSTIITNQTPDKPFNEVANSGRYYVVYTSTKTYASAYAFWEEWRVKYPNMEILENEEKAVFRVGTYAGSSRSEAMTTYKAARKIKSDVWILRPDML